jgi:hypothetical protein
LGRQQHGQRGQKTHSSGDDDRSQHRAPHKSQPAAARLHGHVTQHGHVHTGACSKGDDERCLRQNGYHPEPFRAEGSSDEHLSSQRGEGRDHETDHVL